MSALQTYRQLVSDTLHFLRVEGLLKQEVKEVKAPVYVPPPEPKKNEEVKTKPAPSFDLNVPKTDTYLPNAQMAQIFSQIAPELFLHTAPPNDARAKKMKEGWREKRLVPSIPILVSGGHCRSFLENVAKAIDTTFGSSRIVDIEAFEKEDKWDLFFSSEDLKLIIIPDLFLWGASGLMKRYKEFPQEKTRFLEKIPLLLLADPALYLKDPSLKRSLWTMVCKMLK